MKTKIKHRVLEGEVIRPKRKPTAPKIVTRNKQLTVKLRAAIGVYARAKAVEPEFGVRIDRLIDATLNAYRMDSEKLYDWMAANRYRWKSSRNQWVDLRKE